MSVKPLQTIAFAMVGLASTVLIVAWSAGLYASLYPRFSGHVPPALAALLAPVAVIVALLGVSLGLRRALQHRTGRLFLGILFGIVWVPIYAVAFGGVYWVAAHYLTKEREPVATAFLAFSLALTVFGFGWATETEIWRSAIAFGVSLTLFFAYRFFIGSLTRSAMGFGAVHLVSLFLAMIAAAISEQERTPKAQRTGPNHALQRTAPRVTVAAISSSDPSRPSHIFL